MELTITKKTLDRLVAPIFKLYQADPMSTLGLLDARHIRSHATQLRAGLGKRKGQTINECMHSLINGSVCYINHIKNPIELQRNVRR